MTHDTPAPDASFLIERMNTWSQRAISEKRRAEAAEAEFARLTDERDVLRTRIEAMVEFRPGSEFHRGWSGALSAVLAMIEAMQAEPDKPRDSA